MPIWNPWHGCRKISQGCLNCYVYRRDAEFDKDSSIVTKNADFDMPVKRDRKGEYKLQHKDGDVYTCMTSDFFIEAADEWRPEIWKIIKERSDLSFFIITKRIDRFKDCIPEDWGGGYDNVTIMCTCENQDRADYRLPVFLKMPIKHRQIILAPLLEKVNIEKYLKSAQIEHVTCGGESGTDARICDYEWILYLREQCIKNNISFNFQQTGSLFKKKNKIYHIDRRYQIIQAKKANIDYMPDNLSDKSKVLIAEANHGNCNDELFERLAASKFRSSFSLKKKDLDYIDDKGMDIIRSHADDFIRKRLAPSYIPNDGRQTPMCGHPVFIAQHATGTCCRSCLYKWHGFKPGTELTGEQQKYVADVIMEWIRRQTWKNI